MPGGFGKPLKCRVGLPVGIPPLRAALFLMAELAKLRS